MNDSILEILGPLRQRLDRIYGSRLKAVLLYGSHARHEAAYGSDIDVLVVLAGPVNAAEEISRTIDDVSELSLQDDVVICCLFVSQEEYQRGQSPLLLNVRKEGLPI
jgi:uncharacterized protein